MDYTIINKKTWKRREYFEHYLSEAPCTYSMTIKLDITGIKLKKLKLYPTMLYLLTKTANKYEQFRMYLRDDGELILFSSMNPCYTVFHRETETFSNLWTEYSDDYNVFCENYKNDILKFGDVEGFYAKPDVPLNSFTVSMIPWETFEGFNLNINGFKYLLPIFTMGKYYEEAGKFYLPLAVQVHHAVCDGYHICRFTNDLQAEINTIKTALIY